MLIFLIHESVESVLDDAVDRDLACDHRFWSQAPFAEGVNDLLKIGLNVR